MILFAGTACAYFIGIAMNGVLGEDGFGTLMNATILVAGGFLGFYLARYIHVSAYDTTKHAVLVVSGGFISLAFLSVLKAVFQRFGF
ncbi:MAG: hypothetical protein WAU86_03095 [Oricola sp.]